jgi:hypothetical protein
MKAEQPGAAQCAEALRLCTQLVAARDGPVDPMKARNKAPNAALNQQARGGGYVNKASRALLLRVRARARESAKKVVTYQRSVHTHLRRVMGAAHGTVSSPSIAASKSWRYRRRMI